MLCSQMPRKMPKHIFNLLMLLGGFFLLAFAAKIYLTDPSFYRFGHFRADAVPELAAGTPVYQGTPYCLTCHEERLADWSTSAHSTVQCEVCHGTHTRRCQHGQPRSPRSIWRNTRFLMRKHRSATPATTRTFREMGSQMEKRQIQKPRKISQPGSLTSSPIPLQNAQNVTANAARG